ncbi:unnamed protein product, partial [marine sediment metagenome]
PFYSVFGTEKQIGNIPLGLCYIASVLEGENHDVEILDCETLILGDKYDAGEMAYTHDLNVSYTKYAEVMGNANHPVWKKIARLITKKNADIIGFTTQTATMSPVIHISKILRKESDTKIILGGIHPTVLPALSLEETGADIAVIGEGERTIVELANGNEVDSINGIAYRKDSEICINKSRAFIEDLDTIPFPARHLLDRTKYKDTAFGYLISSRGCPYNCCFCASKKMWGQRTRFRTAVNFVDEIEEVKLRYGTRLFRFTDDTFTLHKDRVLDFCREVKRRDLDIS